MRYRCEQLQSPDRTRDSVVPRSGNRRVPNPVGAAEMPTSKLRVRE